MEILIRPGPWAAVELNDAFTIYAYHGSVIAVELRGHTFRVEPENSTDHRVLLAMLGRHLFATAHVKPQSWFDDLIQHLCPPLPLELEADFPRKEYSNATNAINTN
jgi:hypothetical protein